MLTPESGLTAFIRKLSSCAYRPQTHAGHGVVMNESLPPKELARIRREGRNSRIRRLRRLVATCTVSLVALFSGILMTRALIAQSPTAGTDSISRSLTASVDLGGLLPTSDDDDHESDDDDDGSSASAAPAEATTSAPTPVVTSQS